MRELIERNQGLFAAVMAGALALAFVLTLLVVLVAKKRSGNVVKDGKTSSERGNRRLHEARRMAAPDGVNPVPLSYLVLNDNGRDVFVRSFTIDSLPKRTVFAATFPSLFNFNRTHSSVFIEPIGEGKASHMLDNRIVEIESNIISAEKGADRNQIRKLNAKLSETEGWARKIENSSSGNRTYKIRTELLFPVLFSPSADRSRTDAVGQTATQWPQAIQVETNFGTTVPFASACVRIFAGQTFVHLPQWMQFAWSIDIRIIL